MCMSHFHVVSEAGLESPSKGRRQAQPSPSAAHIPHIPHTPAALGTVLHPSNAPHPCPITRAHPTPVQGREELGNRLWQPLPLPQPQLTTFSTQNFPVINIPASWQETCFSYASPLLLREPFPAAPAACSSPQLFLPTPLRYSRHAAKSAPAQRP